MRFLAVISLALSYMLGAIVSPVQAQEMRFALVIGNQGYKPAVWGLDNPHNDISIVGNALTQVDFNLLPPRREATREEILIAVHQLAEELRKAGLGQSASSVTLVTELLSGARMCCCPINLEGTSDVMLCVHGVRLSEILDILRDAAPDAVHFVELDAAPCTLRSSASMG